MSKLKLIIALAVAILTAIIGRETYHQRELRKERDNARAAKREALEADGRRSPRLGLRWSASTASLLLLALLVSASASPLPSAKPQPAEADSLLAIYSPAELAETVLDLTWLVEDLQADNLRMQAMHAAEMDTARHRAAYLEGVASQKDTHWLIASWEAVDQWVFSLITLVLTLLAVDISVD